MKLSLVFLNRIEYLEELLSAFLEIGISGATVLDSVGMGHIISENIPIFAGLRDAFAGSSPVNKLILVIADDQQVERLEALLEDIFEGVDEGKPYFLASFSIDRLAGFNKNNEL